MILLDTTTKSLQVILDGAITTNQLIYVAGYADLTSSGTTLAETDGTTNGGTAVTMVSAPGASTVRKVTFVNIYNFDTVAQNVTVRVNNNGTFRTLVKAELGIGFTLTLTNEGWKVTDDTGAVMQASAGGTTIELNNPLLDGSVHTDTAAGTVARGDVITGQGATPKWTRLATGAADTVFKTDGTDPSWGKIVNANVDDAAAITGAKLAATVDITTALRTPNTGLKVLDTGGDHYLTIAPGTDLSADRQLTLTTGDAARTVTLSGSPTLDDWFNQSVKTTADPTFNTVLINDSDDSHQLTIACTSNLTAARQLSLATGDAARTITLSGNPTLADWFDQAVKVASSPTFAGATFSGAVAMADNQIQRALLKDYGEIKHAGSATSGACTLDIENGNYFEVTTTGNITFTFSNPTATGNGCSFTLKVNFGGAHTITWPASVRWAGGTEPTETSTSGKTDIFVFTTTDGGTKWFGAVGGQNYTT